ncbi:MAG: hypothetical protein ACOH5I_23130 [Oligoflexus sp.]
MKVFQYFVFASLMLGTNACVTHWSPLMQAEIISMTKSDIPKGSYRKIGEVQSQYCFSSGEEEKALTYRQGDALIGLVDEVVMKAQKENGADGIYNANIEQSGLCVRLEGTAIKLAKRKPRTKS